MAAHGKEGGGEKDQDVVMKFEEPNPDVEFGLVAAPKQAQRQSQNGEQRLENSKGSSGKGMDDLPRAPEVPEEQRTSVKRKIVERMCAICMVGPAINKFLFCKSCKRDVQACKASAEKEGRLEDWNRLTKTAEGLRHLVLHFQTTCPSRGQGVKRDSFDWAGYVRKYFATKQRITGSMEVYMDWIEYEKHALARGQTASEAMNQWQEWESENHDHDFKGRKDYEKRFAVPVKDYIKKETVTGETEDCRDSEYPLCLCLAKCLPACFHFTLCEYVVDSCAMSLVIFR